MLIRRHGVTTDDDRSTLKQERELARAAQAVLEKQRARVLDVMRALAQHLEFIRSCDLRPHELEALAFAQAFLAERKGPGREERAIAEQVVRRA